jgi:hypothetical protein
MSEPGRPPLHPLTYETVDLLIHQADQTYWPQITAMRVRRYYPPDTPVPPPTPELLLNKLLQYASVLFKVEADQYEQLRSGGHYPDWLSRLTDRVVAKVVRAIGQLNDGDSDALLLDYHGLRIPKIEQELKEFLKGIAYQYNRGQFNATPIANAQVAEQQTSPVTKRLTSLIHSPSAAAKMSAYMNRKVLDQTQFSIQAGTSDKTIRKFIKTGYIKRSILRGIAKTMGITTDDLLS